MLLSTMSSENYRQRAGQLDAQAQKLLRQSRKLRETGFPFTAEVMRRRAAKLADSSLDLFQAGRVMALAA